MEQGSGYRGEIQLKDKGETRFREQGSGKLIMGGV